MTGQTSKIRWVIFLLGALYYFYELVWRVSPTVMVDQLITTFNVNAAALGSLSAFYFYAYAPIQLPAGMLMDRFGARRLLTLAILICSIGGLIFAAARDLWVAEVGRLLTGFGSGFAFVGMAYICAHWFDHSKLALLIGLGNSIGMLGSFTGEGPFALGVEHFGWRIPSVILAIIGLVLALLFYFTVKGVPITRRPANHLAERLWANLKVVGRRAQSWNNAAISALIFITASVFAGLWGTPFLQRAHNLSVEAAGFAVSMIFIGWIVGGPITGYLSDRLRNRKAVLFVCSLAVLFCLIPVIYISFLPIWVVYLLHFTLGAFASGQNLCFTIAVELNPLKAKGTAIALTNFVTASFAAIFQPVVGLLLDIHSDGASVYTLGDFRFALSIFPVALIIALVLIILLREAPRKTLGNTIYENL